MRRSSAICTGTQKTIHHPSHENTSEDTHLILVKYLAVMEIGVRKYPIDATTDGAQLGHWWLLDAHPANDSVK